MRLRASTVKLKRLAHDLGYSIRPANVDMCDVPTKTIKINPRHSPRNRVYLLAHELGHAKTLRKCARKFGHALADKSEKSYAVREAEFLAWNYADGLMQQFGLYNKKYLQFKHSMLRLYYRSLASSE